MSIQPTYLRAIRGPIMLIALGVLMLVDHFGNFAFHRTWPVLLVVMGLMVLLERIASPPSNPNQSPWTHGGGTQ